MELEIVRTQCLFRGPGRFQTSWSRLGLAQLLRGWLLAPTGECLVAAWGGPQSDRVCVCVCMGVHCACLCVCGCVLPLCKLPSCVCKCVCSRACKRECVRVFPHHSTERVEPLAGPVGRGAQKLLPRSLGTCIRHRDNMGYPQRPWGEQQGDRMYLSHTPPSLVPK